MCKVFFLLQKYHVHVQEKTGFLPVTHTISVVTLKAYNAASFDNVSLLTFTLIMNQQIAQVALVVKDYDEAIKFYTETLDFQLLEDTPLSPGKRWVLVAPPRARGCALLLAKAADGKPTQFVGNQTGGRVFLFLHTDDFWMDYQKMLERKINFIRPPREEYYGTVAVFEDLYGNLWDLLQPKAYKPDAR
jgi:catechol 2,3-dioxygenase-like lactoylglutathione lyase family enzyme